MAPAGSCPTLDDLRLLAGDQLDPQRAALLEDHLRACASCTARRRQLRGSDTVQTIDRPARPDAGASTIPPCDQAPADGPGRPGVPGYEVLAELGRGGMGVVYKARQVGLDRVVALKMILAGAHAADRDLARFRTEAEAVARLQHPHIVQIHDVGAHDGLPYFSLEFCAGGSLAARLDGTPVAPAPAARLVETLARAMDYAHQKGVVHRDLKPANILLQRETTNHTKDTNEKQKHGTARTSAPGAASAPFDSCDSSDSWLNSLPKIADFGLAKKLDAAGQTQSGAVVGTPSYMAPEQAQGQTQEIGPAADVYSLGAILYELLTGRPPFRAATPLDTLLQVVCDEPVPPSRLNGQVPRDLETVCLKCLHKEPRKRYGTAGALAEDLRRFQAGEPIVARPVGRAERAVKWVRRNPVVAALGACVALALLGGAAFSTYFAVVASHEAGQAKQNEEQANQNAAAARRNETRAKENETAAKTARKQAEELAIKEGVARGLAEAETARANAQRRRAEGLTYASKLLLAKLAFEANNGALALAYLDECQPELRDWEHRHLLTRYDSKITFRGHTGPVTEVAFSPDGLRSASADGTVKLWDVGTRQALATVGVKTGRVVFSPDGKRLAAIQGGPDKPGTVQLCDPGTGKVLHTLGGNSTEITSVAFSPDGSRVATACAHPRYSTSKGEVRVWDAEKGQALYTAAGFPNGACAVAFSPDGKTLVVTRSGTELKLLEAATGKHLRTLTGSMPALTPDLVRLRFSPDGKRLASAAGFEGTLRVWDVESGKHIWHARRDSGRLTGVAFSPDGLRVAAASFDRDNPSNPGDVKVFVAANGLELLTLKAHRSGVNGVAFSPNGKHLVSAGGDGVVKWWDTERGQDVLTFGGFGRAASAVAFSPDSQRVAGVGGSGIVRMWDVRTGREAVSFKKIAAHPTGVAFSPDGKRLVTVAVSRKDPTLQVWDAKTGQQVQTLGAHGRWSLTAVAFSADGKRLATASMDRTARLWEGSTLKGIRELPKHGNTVLSVAVSPNGQRIATGSADHTARLWDGLSGKEIRTLTGHGSAVMGVAFSADGLRLATASWDRTIKVWDAATGKELVTLTGHADGVRGVAFSPDGKRLASAGNDRSVKLWNPATGQEVFTLAGHAKGVMAVAFSPNGEYLASASEDGTVKVWEAAARP